MAQLDPTLVILLVGSCVAASCALIGTFLVLRQMALWATPSATPCCPASSSRF